MGKSKIHNPRRKRNIIIGFVFLFTLVISSGNTPPQEHIASALQERSTTKENSSCFLFLSDLHLNSTTDSSAYGSDTGMELWKHYLNKVDSVLGSNTSIRFIIFGGDLAAHYDCKPSCYLPPAGRGMHKQNIAIALTALRNQAEKHHIPIFCLPGNIDGLAGDYCSFADEKQQTPFSLATDSTNPFPALNILPGSIVAPCMLSNPHPAMGYYAARPTQGLRLIMLNTIIYSSKFLAVDGSEQQADGDTQLEWLAAQLKDARSNKEKVYIAMHIPPGLDAYSGNSMWVKIHSKKESWEETFLSITSTYRATIAGIFYGHTHMDELRRLYDPAGKTITEVAISCPGLTPQHGNNPGFKTVKYDAASKEIMDFTTYYSTPAGTSWGNRTYTFGSAFNSPPGKSIYRHLCTMKLSVVTNGMNKIYTLKNGPATFHIQTGIEVKCGQ